MTSITRRSPKTAQLHKNVLDIVTFKKLHRFAHETRPQIKLHDTFAVLLPLKTEYHHDTSTQLSQAGCMYSVSEEQAPRGWDLVFPELNTLMISHNQQGIQAGPSRVIEQPVTSHFLQCPNQRTSHRGKLCHALPTRARPDRTPPQQSSGHNDGRLYMDHPELCDVRFPADSLRAVRTTLPISDVRLTGKDKIQHQHPFDNHIFNAQVKPFAINSLDPILMRAINETTNSKRDTLSHPASSDAIPNWRNHCVIR